MYIWRNLEDVDFCEVLSVLKPLRGQRVSKVKIASYIFCNTPCLFTTSVNLLKTLMQLGILSYESSSITLVNVEEFNENIATR